MKMKTFTITRSLKTSLGGLLSLLLLSTIYIGCDSAISPDNAASPATDASPFAAETESGGDALTSNSDRLGKFLVVTDCSFTTAGTVMSLDADCTTDGSILVPDGFTLNGNGHTITGVDPAGDHFRGAVVTNAGATAHVNNLGVTVSGLTNTCDGGDDRLRGIMFEGASGSITHNTVSGINQGPSGCQEGNGIEVRNAPYDGTHPGTVSVNVSHNTVTDYQKGGIISNGDVDVDVRLNKVGASATQLNLAANSVQFGFGATGSMTSNTIDGNQWLGTSNYAATAVLIYLSNDIFMSSNRVKGNSDIAVYNYGDDNTLEKNNIVDEGEDAPTSGYDYGLGNWGANTTLEKNHVRGFEIPADPPFTDDGDKNKALPNNLEI